QHILNIFRRTFTQTFNSALPDTLQAVKQHLYNREYAAAFGTEENLRAYVVRWSPSRALAYRTIFLETCDELRGIFDVEKMGAGRTEVVSIGGGAGAEVVAAAAAQKVEPNHSQLHLTSIDIASWTEIITSLATALTVPLTGPNPQPAFVNPSTYSSTFHQGDILLESTKSLINKSTKLITMLFTTNELFTQSTTAATLLLSNLGDQVSSGTLLLVVESAGSYSTVKLGEREYPMPWLLDLVLLGQPDSDEFNSVWKKVYAEDAKWFRLPKDVALKYPIELENMRYLIRVYRRV
ncbi:hypothetical protein DFH27DRAFT_620622, partial [Peziza echinospora]